VWDTGTLSREERWSRLGARGGTLWFTGLSGSGKSTVAAAVEAGLVRQGRLAYRLDGDNLRHGLNGDLGFSAEDRQENVRRVGEVAELLADAGAVALVALVSPFRSGRDAVRTSHAEAGLDFWEIWVNTSLEECRKRDPKGLYRRAAGGEVVEMTGLSSPYEAPAHADLELPMDQLTVAEGVAAVLGLLGEPAR
jgi:adenylylsulfate kinase